MRRAPDGRLDPLPERIAACQLVKIDPDIFPGKRKCLLQTTNEFPILRAVGEEELLHAMDGPFLWYLRK